MRQKLLEKVKMSKFKLDIFGDFQTMWVGDKALKMSTTMARIFLLPYMASIPIAKMTL